MDLEQLKKVFPPYLRLWLYVVWVLAALTVGAISAWVDGNLEWLPNANRTLEFLMVPLAVLAAANVDTEDV